VNDGRGRFHKDATALPVDYASGSCVVAADVDGDGDLDLFVGARSVPGRYGIVPTSMLLVNDGRGHFSDATARLAPELAQVGLVTDAIWRDADGDGRVDLVVVGDWMPITVFHNAGGGRLRRVDAPALAHTHGWWNRIVAGDFDGDGRVDFVVGNLGLNTRLQASAAEPVRMYVKDFDGNGFVEQIVTHYEQGRSYPLALRDELLKTLPYLKARYLKYASYANQTVDDVFSAKDREGAIVHEAETFASVFVHNDGGGRFSITPLPDAAQVAPIFGLAARDVDGDGRLDVLLGGNFDGVKPELGRMAASDGLVLRGDGAGGFTPFTGMPLAIGSNLDAIIAGDWNNDGSDSIGGYLPSTGGVFLKNTIANGAADITFVFGSGGATPRAGDWDNLP
jgi:hypothetical protein